MWRETWADSGLCAVRVRWVSAWHSYCVCVCESASVSCDHWTLSYFVSYFFCAHAHFFFFAFVVVLVAVKRMHRVERMEKRTCSNPFRIDIGTHTHTPLLCVCVFRQRTTARLTIVFFGFQTSSSSSSSVSLLAFFVCLHTVCFRLIFYFILDILFFFFCIDRMLLCGFNSILYATLDVLDDDEPATQFIHSFLFDFFCSPRLSTYTSGFVPRIREEKKNISNSIHTMWRGKEWWMPLLWSIHNDVILVLP